MSIVFAGILIVVFGVLAYAAPKRKRYRSWTRVADCSIDGDDNRDAETTIGDLGVFSHDAGSHVGGHDVGGHDCGGFDGGSDGGSCGSD